MRSTAHIGGHTNTNDMSRSGNVCRYLRRIRSPQRRASTSDGTASPNPYTRTISHAVLARHEHTRQEDAKGPHCRVRPTACTARGAGVALGTLAGARGGQADAVARARLWEHTNPNTNTKTDITSASPCLHDDAPHSSHAKHAHTRPSKKASPHTHKSLDHPSRIG